MQGLLQTALNSTMLMFVQHHSPSRLMHLLGMSKELLCIHFEFVVYFPVMLTRLTKDVLVRKYEQY